MGIGLALSALYQVSNSKSLPMREISYSQQTSRFYEAPPERQASTRYEVPLTYSGRKTAAKTLDTRKR